MSEGPLREPLAYSDYIRTRRVDSKIDPGAHFSVTYTVCPHCKAELEGLLEHGKERICGCGLRLTLSMMTLWCELP